MPVLTTRPDTLFGATFFVAGARAPARRAVGNDEVRASGKRGARGRRGTPAKEKDGVLTGDYTTRSTAAHPGMGRRLRLMDYGTGAIMAVPAHDERDLEFAERYGLEIRPVIDEEKTRWSPG